MKIIILGSLLFLFSCGKKTDLAHKNAEVLKVVVVSENSETKVEDLSTEERPTQSQVLEVVDNQKQTIEIQNEVIINAIEDENTNSDMVEELEKILDVQEEILDKIEEVATVEEIEQVQQQINTQTDNIVNELDIDVIVVNNNTNNNVNQNTNNNKPNVVPPKKKPTCYKKKRCIKKKRKMCNVRFRKILKKKMKKCKKKFKQCKGQYKKCTKQAKKWFKKRKKKCYKNQTKKCRRK